MNLVLIFIIIHKQIYGLEYAFVNNYCQKMSNKSIIMENQIEKLRKLPVKQQVLCSQIL